MGVTSPFTAIARLDDLDFSDRWHHPTPILRLALPLAHWAFTVAASAAAYAVLRFGFDRWCRFHRER